MLIVLLLSPKVIALYKDYEEQMKAKKDPYYNPDKISWSGVDKEMWKDINKKYIVGKVWFVISPKDKFGFLKG